MLAWLNIWIFSLDLIIAAKGTDSVWTHGVWTFGVWIGANDIDQTTKFFWMDGSPGNIFIGTNIVLLYNVAFYGFLEGF